MPKQKKEQRGRRRRHGAKAHSDSDIRAGPWTDSSDGGGGGASEDEAARGFIDDVTADLARVNPTNGICIGLPWEAPLAAKASRRHRSKKSQERNKGSRKHDDNRGRGNKDNGDGKERRDRKRDAERDRERDARRAAKEAATGALRKWSHAFETEGRDAERVFAAVGTVEACEWHRRYRAWLVEWGVASGDCRRVLRKGRSKEMGVTVRGLRSTHAARDAGAEALRGLLSATTPAQRRDPNWVRLHHFGGAYVGLTRDLDLWIAGLEASAVAR